MIYSGKEETRSFLTSEIRPGFTTSTCENTIGDIGISGNSYIQLIAAPLSAVCDILLAADILPAADIIGEQLILMPDIEPCATYHWMRPMHSVTAIR